MKHGAYIGSAITFSIFMIIFGIAPIGRGREKTIAGIVMLIIGNLLCGITYFVWKKMKNRSK